jgi:hypothetical protein
MYLRNIRPGTCTFQFLREVNNDGIVWMMLAALMVVGGFAMLIAVVRRHADDCARPRWHRFTLWVERL